mmetsp:Transcript_17036/g.35220  ORF Transcript_17036/g.35220 Transcript_17036/m.35220 type:complete len:546 (+) Transcript_17036:42-1679(+)
MGNATIDIVLENGQGLAQAGSWLKGYVLVHVLHGGINAVSLDLRFIGREFAEVEYDESEGTGDERRSVRRTDTSHRSLADIRIPVNDMCFIDKATGSRVDPGQYQIPFALEIPSYLPGSMYLDHGHSGRCYIKYSLKAILKGSGVLWNYHKERNVEVIAKSIDQRLPPAPFNAPPVNERVNFCCCFNKGSISLGGRVGDTRLFPGASLDISMSVRNYSTANPRRVQARLRQEVKWGSAGRSCHMNDSVVSVDFPSIIESHVTRHQRLPGSVHSAHVQNELQDIFHEIENGVHQGTLIVPPDTLNSYSGHLITVKHRLELEVQTGCCLTDPSIYVPLFIGQMPLSNGSDFASQVSSPQYSPPMASSGVVQAPVVVVDGEDVLPVIHVPSSNVFPSGVAQGSAPYEDDVYVSPLAEVPSFSMLIREMKGTASHLDLIERRMKNPEWTPVWQQMTVFEFGKVVSAVSMGFDQPRVAEEIAKQIGSSFRCEYVVTALQSSLDYQRAKMVETLIPYCGDINENHSIIKRELTDWEQVVTERAFAHALEAK